MKNTLTILLILISFSALAQTDDEYWKPWNKNYSETDISAIVKKELKYA